MNVHPAALPDVLVIEPEVLNDARGAFFESFRADRCEAAGVAGPFVQENVSRSSKGVLRGLHLQHPNGQAKLLSVLHGEVFDVAVDVRVGSPTFGKWVGECLSAENCRQLYVPAGFAHGFLVTSEQATVAYKCTDYYAPKHELVIRWNDPSLAIAWPFSRPILSARDENAPNLATLVAERRLPDYSER